MSIQTAKVVIFLELEIFYYKNKIYKRKNMF